VAQPSHQQLKTENEELKRRVAELESRVARIAGLEAQIEKLTLALEKSHRVSKRQAAPFSKRQTKKHPKKPGRKSGEQHGDHAHRQAPQRIDEVHEAPLPEHCPDCGGDVRETHMDHQYQTEIPRQPIYRQFNVHLGECLCCQRRLQGRHELQTSDALGAAASQLGPDAQAAVVVLNKRMGLSHGKISQTFDSLFGFSLSRGGSAQIMLRSGRRCEGAYQDIRRAVRDAAWVVPDETGWRLGGRPAWLHAFVSETATYYEIAFSRGFDVPAGVLGEDYRGALIHDGWSVYDRFQFAYHQQCLNHLMRRCREMIDASPSCSAALLPSGVLALCREGLRLREERDADRLNLGDAAWEGLVLCARMKKLSDRAWRSPTNRRLAKHVGKHAWQWFSFLIKAGLDATNYRAEQAIRPAVVNRKVWGGNRTVIGARAQSVLTSVLETCRQAGRSAMEYLISTLQSRNPISLLNS
jgi:transposase